MNIEDAIDYLKEHSRVDPKGMGGPTVVVEKEKLAEIATLVEALYELL